MGLAGIKASNILAKATGLAALTLIGYDAHTYAKTKGPEAAKRFKANSLTEQLYFQNSLDTPSVVKSKLKKKFFDINMNENISDFFLNVKGYLGGIGSNLVDNVLPLGLALGTMVGKANGEHNIISKFSALGLVAYGAIFVLQEGLGIGKTRTTNLAHSDQF